MPVAAPVQTIDIAKERCDRCGQRAWVVTETDLSDGRTLPLSWCAHHYRMAEATLAVTSRVVIDARSRLH